MLCCIIEAPGKREAIARALQISVRCVLATGGHWMHNPAGLYPLQVDLGTGVEFARRADLRVLQRMLQGCRGAAEIAIACDADQEGDVIARDVCVALRDSGARLSRMRLGGMDEGSVRRAFQERTPMDPQSAVLPGDVRRVVDRVLAAGLSRPAEGLYVGRVRAALLERLAAPEHARAWVHVRVPGEGGEPPWVGEGFVSSTQAASIRAAESKGEWPVPRGDRAAEPRGGPTTMSMLLDAWSEEGLAPRETSEGLQALYEAGLCSYPRTGSAGLSDAARRWGMRALMLSGYPAGRQQAGGHQGNEPSEDGHPCIYPLDERLQAGLQRPLGGVSTRGDGLMLLLGQRVAAAVMQPQTDEPVWDERAPEWVRTMQWRRVMEAYPGSRQRSERGCEVRPLPPEVVALVALRDAGIGRPATYVAHARGIAQLGLITPEGELSTRGRRYLDAVQEFPAARAGAICRRVDRLTPADVYAGAGVYLQEMLGSFSQPERALLYGRLSASSASGGSCPLGVDEGGGGDVRVEPGLL